VRLGDSHLEGVTFFQNFRM